MHNIINTGFTAHAQIGIARLVAVQTLLVRCGTSWDEPERDVITQVTGRPHACVQGEMYIVCLVTASGTEKPHLFPACAS